MQDDIARLRLKGQWGIEFEEKKYFSKTVTKQALNVSKQFPRVVSEDRFQLFSEIIYFLRTQISNNKK